MCFKSLSAIDSLLDLVREKDVLCRECREKLLISPIQIEFDDFVLRSIYCYQDFFQKLLVQYKDLNDEALYPIFLYPTKEKLKKLFKGTKVVCIPSHVDHVAKRGFKQVELLLDGIVSESEPVLIKVSSRYQQKTKREERKEKLFEISYEFHFKKCILVDDMCTSGQSLSQAYELLRPYCEDLKCFSLGYHPLLIKQKPSKRWKLK